MAERIETRLERLLSASKKSGHVVLSALVRGDEIELKYGEAAPEGIEPIDAVSWKRKK